MIHPMNVFSVCRSISQDFPTSAMGNVGGQRCYWVRVPVEMHVFHISSIVLVPWSSCLGGYLSVPDDYPLLLGCEEQFSALGAFVA